MTDETLRLFTRASKVLRGVVDADLRRHGVRIGQNSVLEALWKTDGLTPGELAAKLHVATPTMVKVAARMEASGLLTRQRDAADRRLVRLYLTEQAWAIRGALQADWRELEDRVNALLESDECLRLRSALAKIVAEFGPVATAGASGVGTQRDSSPGGAAAVESSGSDAAIDPAAQPRALPAAKQPLLADAGDNDSGRGDAVGAVGDSRDAAPEPVGSRWASNEPAQPAELARLLTDSPSDPPGQRSPTSAGMTPLALRDHDAGRPAPRARGDDPTTPVHDA
jgi:DNA-binding MarR family transcriptional regulator